MTTGQPFTLLWRNKFLTTEAKSLDDMIATFQEATKQLQQMKAAGVLLQDDGGVEDDYAVFETSDPVVAERFGFAQEMAEEENDDEDFDPEDN